MSENKNKNEQPKITRHKPRKKGWFDLDENDRGKCLKPTHRKETRLGGCEGTNKTKRKGGNDEL